ncbi:tripartite tricarboxylate transporter substrate binding protein [Paraburkholderia phymatum]|uniref:Bug family tripartite tricarboxylate transporter substrate binding protein n=1 Tax=Paraburkholderia phymatum TaxID=148447 RepID=UPI003178B469
MLKFLKAAVVIAVCAASAYASAGEYPDHPIKLIISNAPGGGTDITGRIIADGLSKKLGQAVVVENHPGAAGLIGDNIAAKSPADGYSILYDSASFTVNPAIRKLSYDPVNDFIPLSLSVSQPNVLVVAANSPIKTLQDYIKAAKDRPGKITFGSAGIGTGQHMTGELFRDRAHVDILHVPYKAGAAVYVDLIGGQITSYFANLGSAMEYIRSGKLRALAVTSAQRNPRLPDVPTLEESGFPGFVVLEWAGAYVPKGTPPAVVDQLSKNFQEVVQDAKVKHALETAGVDVVGDSQADFKKFLDAEFKRWDSLAKENNIRAQ